MFGTTVNGMRRDPSSSGPSIWLLEAMGIKEKVVGISIPFLKTAGQFTNGIKRELMDNPCAGVPWTRRIYRLKGCQMNRSLLGLLNA